jgi:hypothetical protein
LKPADVANGMKKVVKYAWPSDVDQAGDPTGSVYPLKEKVFGEILLDNISRGVQDTFYVAKGDELIATFCNVRKPSKYGRDASVELGRTAADYRYLPELKDQKLSLRGISQLRLLHLLINQDYKKVSGQEIDFIYSDIRVMGRTRVSSDETILVPNARSVQGVFFGGINRTNSVDLDFGILGAGWQYVMGDRKDGSGGCEPFMRIGQFMESEKLEKSLKQRIIWVPDEQTKETILAFLSSQLDITSLSVEVMDSQAIDQSFDPAVVMSPGLSTAYTSLDFIDVSQEGIQNIKHSKEIPQFLLLSEALTQIEHTIGQIDHQVPYIEAYCECTTLKDQIDQVDIKKMQQTMELLLDLGFTVTGFTPSDKTDGIRITFSLITKHGLSKGLEPYELPSDYYSGNRTSHAISEVKKVFTRLEKRSLESKLNKGKYENQ